MKIMMYLSLVLIFVLLLPISLRSTDEWYNKAEQAMKSKNYKDAVKYYGLSLDHNKMNIMAYNRRGQAHMFNGDIEAAINDFTAYIKKNQSSADVYNYRGLAYGYIGEIEKSISDFDKAIGLDPKFAEAYLNRATANASMGKFDKAIKDLDKSLKIDPKNPESYFQRGNALYNKDKVKNAISDFTTAINYGLKSSQVYHYRGNAYYKQQDYKRAIADYTKAIEIDPKNHEAINNRAMAYDKAGQKNLAENDRKKLSDLAGNRFVPFEQLKFIKYTDDKNEFKIELPDNWNRVSNVSANASELVVSFEKIKKYGDPYAVGARFSMNWNMTHTYKIPAGTSLMDFWLGSQGQNSANYAEYKVVQQKTLRINEWDGLLVKTGVQFTKESIKIRMFEVVLIKNDDLFYAYFQCPDQQYDYYEKVFDKAMKSLWVN